MAALIWSTATGTFLTDGTHNFAAVGIVNADGSLAQIGSGASISGGATTCCLRSAASTNATSLKATPGNVYGLQLINRSTTANAYFNLFDKASTPTVGSDTPVKSICIPAAVSAILPTEVVVNFPMPISFTLGIAFDIVGGTGLVADTTAVALNDVTANIDYK